MECNSVWQFPLHTHKAVRPGIDCQKKTPCYFIIFHNARLYFNTEGESFYDNDKFMYDCKK